MAPSASAVPSASLVGVVAFANGVIIDFRDAVAAIPLLHLDDDIDQKQQQRADIVAMKVTAFRTFLHQQGQLLEGEPGAIGMDRRDRSWMSGVHVPQIEERGPIPKLLQQDPIWS